MRVLLTGATGFIGSHVARLAVADGCDVHAVMRPGSDTWRIDDLAGSLEVIPYDMFSSGGPARDLDAIIPELCVHLAWYAEPGKYVNGLENTRCLGGSLQFATELARRGCRRFVGIGTCAEYQPGSAPLRETSRTAPESLYAATKLGLAMALEHVGRLTDMEIAWARVFYLYGPYEDERRLVPSVVRRLDAQCEARVTEGTQIRDFLHVEDVAAGVWSVARSRLVGPVNIGSGEPIAVRDLVTRLGDLLGRPELIRLGALPINPAEPPYVCADNARLREGTSWRPRYGIDEGLRHTVDWWRSRR